MRNISLFGFIMYFQGLYNRISTFLNEWEKEMIAAEKEREEKSKMPLPSPCPNCGGEFSVAQYLPGPSFNQDFTLSSPAPAMFPAFPGQGITIKVCSTCRMPV